MPKLKKVKIRKFLIILTFLSLGVRKLPKVMRL